MYSCKKAAKALKAWVSIDYCTERIKIMFHYSSNLETPHTILVVTQIKSLL